MYVIVNNDNNKFATPEGSEYSYTRNLQNAQVFKTEIQAREFGVCGNECVVPLEDYLHIKD